MVPGHPFWYGQPDVVGDIKDELLKCECTGVEFVTFLSYLPLFMTVQNTISQNPLGNVTVPKLYTRLSVPGTALCTVACVCARRKPVHARRKRGARCRGLRLHPPHLHIHTLSLSHTHTHTHTHMHQAVSAKTISIVCMVEHRRSRSRTAAIAWLTRTGGPWTRAGHPARCTGRATRRKRRRAVTTNRITHATFLPTPWRKTRGLELPRSTFCIRMNQQRVLPGVPLRSSAFCRAPRTVRKSHEQPAPPPFIKSDF